MQARYVTVVELAHAGRTTRVLACKLFYKDKSKKLKARVFLPSASLQLRYALQARD